MYHLQSTIWLLLCICHVHVFVICMYMYQLTAVSLTFWTNHHHVAVLWDHTVL